MGGQAFYIIGYIGVKFFKYSNLVNDTCNLKKAIPSFRTLLETLVSYFDLLMRAEIFLMELWKVSQKNSIQHLLTYFQVGNCLFRILINNCKPCCTNTLIKPLDKYP
ncbi:hypothetical protein [Neobacillus niacini]|uniref:hypothetical protein n=1 Tax=Neobacillus niacini TaxID=86668 RepID=UPI001C8E8D5F|nr:hypothetical protein [Neobacillus niacini]